MIRSQLMVVQSVQTPPSFCAALDEADIIEHPKMLGHLRLRQTQHVDELPDRPLPRHKRVQDFPAVGLGDRIEDVRIDGGTSHANHHIPMSAYVKSLKL